MGLTKLACLLTLVLFQTWTYSHAQVFQEDIFDCVAQASSPQQSLVATLLDPTQDFSIEELTSPGELSDERLPLGFQNQQSEPFSPVPRVWQKANAQLSFLSLFTNSPPQLA